MANKKSFQTTGEFALTIERFFKEIVLSDSMDDENYRVKEIDRATGDLITTNGRRIPPKIYFSDIIELVPKYFFRD